MTTPHLRHRVDVQTRFGDTDALGHVNNAAFASYAELGRLEFLATLGNSVTSLILANLTIDFRRQVKFRDAVSIDTWVRRLGTSSMELAQAVWANGELAADIRTVTVHFDYAAGRAHPLTDAMREALAPYVEDVSAATALTADA